MAVKTKTRKTTKASSNGSTGLKYPDYHSRDFVGDKAITAADMKEMLDWEEVTDENYQFIDMLGNKVRCNNNTKNRPLDRNHAVTLTQKLLHRHWAGPNGNGKTPNGESMSIGQSGQVLSGQHRGIGLVFAYQIWAYEGDDPDLKARAEHAREVWGDQEPVMDCTICFGVSEDADTMATLDNVKPRSFADTLYCDPDTFPKMKGKDRIKACRMADTAVNILWSRTGEKNDKFSPKRTHQEAWAFLKAHQKLKESLAFVFGNDGDGQISGQTSKVRIPAGTAAALHYLMMASATDPAAYFANDPRVESIGKKKFVDFSMEPKADEFWVSLTSGNPQFKGLREALGTPFGDDYHGEFSVLDREHVIVTGWNHFKDGGKMTRASTFYLPYDEKDDGRREASEFPKIEGGIDLGDPKPEKPEKAEPSDEELLEPEVDQEDVEGDDEDDDVEVKETAAQKKKREAQKAKLLANRKKKAKAKKAEEEESDEEAEEYEPMDTDDDDDEDEQELDVEDEEYE